MRPGLILAALAAASVLALGGCGGGGGSSSAAVLSGGQQQINTPGVFTRTGTFRFNLLPVTALTIQDDSGSVLTPINPPSNALEGERVQFTFRVATSIPSFFRPLPQPVELISIVRL